LRHLYQSLTGREVQPSRWRVEKRLEGKNCSYRNCSFLRELIVEISRKENLKTASVNQRILLKSRRTKFCGEVDPPDAGAIVFGITG